MLEQICDWIVLFGAVTVAILNIIKFFAKPTSFFKKKKDNDFQNHLKNTLDGIIPNYFQNYDLETRDKFLNEINDKIMRSIKDTLEEIKQINIEQSKNLEILNQGLKDVLRQKIMSIYHQYKKKQILPIFTKEALDELYKDYKNQGGNSYIDKYYNRMKIWKISSIDDEIEG